ncbi:MAG: hypothetical protein Q4G16_01215 [Cruoricaptor ignavus]|nr:hypothetical protein [Cruoricaptor ignavus]
MKKHLSMLQKLRALYSRIAILLCMGFCCFFQAQDSTTKDSLTVTEKHHGVITIFGDAIIFGEFQETTTLELEKDSTELERKPKAITKKINSKTKQVKEAPEEKIAKTKAESFFNILPLDKYCGCASLAREKFSFLNHQVSIEKPIQNEPNTYVIRIEAKTPNSQQIAYSKTYNPTLHKRGPPQNIVSLV